MNEVYTNCDYEPERHRASVRRTTAECEECGTLCDECLASREAAAGFMDRSEAEDLAERIGAGAFIHECLTTGLRLCAQCFERTKEDQAN